MKTIRTLALTGLLILPLPLGLSACAGMPPPAPRVVTDADAGAITLARGQTLEVRLPSSAGTGYAWRLDREAAPLILNGGSSRDTDAPRPGGPVVTVYTYQAAARGETDLAFTFKRPWEANSPSDRKVVFQVRVR